jgi:hypothetical protein
LTRYISIDIKSYSIGEYSPHDPRNKPGYDKLPVGVKCRDCPAFNELKGFSGIVFVVACEFFDGNRAEIVRAVPDPSEDGGMIVVKGHCRKLYPQ